MGWSRTWDSLRLRLWLGKVRRQANRSKGEPSRAAADGPILLLAGLFPPTVSGGVYRAVSFIEHAAAQQGCRFVVVAGAPYEPVSEAGRRLLARVPAHARVGRVRVPSLRSDPRFVTEVDGTLAAALASYEEGLRICRDQPPRVVVAMGPPFHSFVAGAWLAARFGCRLVLDYGDEWSESPFDFVRLTNGDRQWEAFCLQSASAVVFTTESQRRHQLGAFPLLEEGRCHVVDNPWEPAVRGHRPTGPGHPSPGVRLGFFGRLANHALPGDFLADLERLLAEQPARAKQLRIEFTGQKSESALEQLGRFSTQGVLELVDLVSHQEAARRMEECAGLLLLTNESLGRYRPGKLTEYVAAGRMVLAHGVSHGESPDLVRALGAGVVVQRGDIGALALGLDRMADFQTWRPSERVQTWLQARSGPAFADRLLEICLSSEASP